MASDWTEIDNGLLDPAWYADGEPHDAFARLRREDPVHWTESANFGRSFWTVTPYEVVSEVLNNSTQFSNMRGSRPPRTPVRVTTEDWYAMSQDALLSNMDEPVHAMFRQPVNKYFSVPSIKRMRGQVEEIVDDLLASAAGRGEVEFVEDIAGEVPMFVVLQFLGVPREDWADLRRAVWESFAPADPRFAVAGQTAQQTMFDARSRLVEYSAQLSRSKRQNPGDDFATVLSTIEVDGTALDEHELAAWYSVIILAGLETTRNAAASGLWLFDRNPDQRRLLDEDPGLMGSAIDEILRMSTPVRARFRVARSDTELAGASIKAGDWIIPVLASANYDDTVFEEPTRFDIRRDPNPYLTLGTGIHRCLGRHLARLELDVIYSKFFAAFPDFTIRNADDSPRLVDHVMSGFARLDVELQPGNSAG